MGGAVCLFLPETDALRPGRPALGRLTCVSVPSIRGSKAGFGFGFGFGFGEDTGRGAQSDAG
jgi:hypothetical protein